MRNTRLIQVGTLALVFFVTTALSARAAECAMCHGKKGTDKKVLSDYAKLLRDALQSKNEKRGQKIREALDQVSREYAGEGETYGDLFDLGALPPPPAPWTLQQPSPRSPLKVPQEAGIQVK